MGLDLKNGTPEVFKYLIKNTKRHKIFKRKIKEPSTNYKSPLF